MPLNIPFFTSKACPDLTPHKSQESQDSIITKLVLLMVQRGSLTVREAVPYTNGQTWAISRMRARGLILPMDMDTWEVGSQGQRYKRYYPSNAARELYNKHFKEAR